MPKDVRNQCEDKDGNFKVPHVASNSDFSTLDLEEDDNDQTGLVNHNADGLIEDEYVPQNQIISGNFEVL